MTDTNRSGDLEELERFRQDCGIPDLPTPLTYDLRRAISGQGPRAYDWEDKPHRLVYVACREIEAKAREADELRAEIERLRGALQWMVDNDETNEGDEPMEDFGGQSWNEINAYWIEGLNRARAALGEKQ